MLHRVGVRRFVLAALALALLLPLKPARVGAQGQGTYEGILSIVWGDPRFPGTGAGGERYFLTSPDGQSVEMEVTQNHNVVLRYQGHRVLVTGQIASRARSAADPTTNPRLVASAIVDDPRIPNQTPSVRSDVSADPTSGTKKVVFVLLKYANDGGAGDGQAPHSSTFFLNLINPDPSVDGSIPTTINTFFKKVSNNTFSWLGDVAGSAYLTLPQPKSYYANCNFSISCLNFTRFNTDAVALAKGAGVNFALYDNVNFVINNDLDCCAWGGSIVIDGRSLGATWEPPWGQQTSTYAHEMGHSLGLPHSGWLYFSYDSPWDTMSAIRIEGENTCGSYISRNSSNTTQTLFCDTPGDGYIAGHRDFLGWIPAANQVSITPAAPTTITLEANAVPLSTGTKLIKICLPSLPCDPLSATAHYFTVETRVRDAGTAGRFDNGVPSNGVIIHDFMRNRPPISGACYFNNQSGWAVPVDATPGDYNAGSCSEIPGGGLLNAQFTPGMVYTNSTYGFKVTIGARTGNTYAVTVQSATPPATQVTVNPPANGATVSSPFLIAGWAINRGAATGTGVDQVVVYATPAGGSQTFIGQATYGAARSDVAALYGSQFTNSGYSLNATLAPGNYTITVYARNTAPGAGFDGNASTNITVAGPTTQPFIAVDTPTSNQVLTSAFEVGGWALDKGAPTGTGVDAVQFYVVPSGGSAPGVFIGQGSYGAARTDVAAVHGSRFTNVGYHFTITGLGPGAYTLGVYAHSTVTNAYSIVQMVPFTVSATSLMSVDLPGPEAVITDGGFGVAGWSIDRNVEGVSPSGTGIDALHIYAYPNPGSGTPPIFLGLATLGTNRPDVASAYGSRYANSGYSLIVNRAALGLGPGVYSIAVHAHSSVSNSFNNIAVVRVTLQ